VSLAVPHVAPAAAQGSKTLSRSDYEACQAHDAASFRSAIETLTFNALKAGAARADYGKIVADEWRKAGMDVILDKQVDIAVEEIRRETSWATLISTIANKEKAIEIGTAVAERVYRSEAVKKALEDLSTGVGRDMARRIELATGDAAEPAVHCIQAFLGPRYGNVVAGTVSTAAGKELDLDASNRSATVSTGQIVLDSKEGIAGAVILIVRRQLSRMAARVGQRLVGAILSRLVAVVSSGIGIALIAKDLWELRNGILPIIANEMKSAEAKDKVRQELAAGLAEQINEGLHETASQTAGRIIEIWQTFRTAHARVLDLAERHPQFKAFLDAQSPERLARVDELVGLVLAEEGEAGVLKRLADGTLHDAINRLPQSAVDIARDTRSVATAFAWSSLAGANLQKVVDLELHRSMRPGDLTKDVLDRLLAIDDRGAIARIVAVPASARAQLFELPRDDLRKLANNLQPDYLRALAGYLARLNKPAAERLLRAVVLAPDKMRWFASARVQDGILSSADQLQAVDLMLRSEALPNPADTYADIRLAVDGKVSPLLIWERHPIAISSVGGLALLVLMVVWRALFGRRPRRSAAPPAAGYAMT